MKRIMAKICLIIRLMSQIGT